MFFFIVHIENVDIAMPLKFSFHNSFYFRIDDTFLVQVMQVTNIMSNECNCEFIPKLFAAQLRPINRENFRIFSSSTSKYARQLFYQQNIFNSVLSAYLLTKQFDRIFN